MMKSLFAVVLALSLRGAALGQSAPDASRDKQKTAGLGLSYSSGSATGYGTGWGGTGYGPYFYGGGGLYGYSSGFGGLFSGGAFPNPSPYGYTGPYGGLGYFGSGDWGAGRYGGFGYRGTVDHRRAAAEVAGPSTPADPMADRMPDYAAAREIEEGRRRLKAGDYHGAVDLFRAAVSAQTQSAVAQAWFAVGLSITGDGRNADKALKAAAGGGAHLDQLTLGDGFHDDRERAKVVGTLSRVSGEGSLAAAFTMFLAGDATKLKQLAGKDATARALLPKP